MINFIHINQGPPGYCDGCTTLADPKKHFNSAHGGGEEDGPEWYDASRRYCDGTEDKPCPTCRDVFLNTDSAKTGSKW